MANYIIMDWNTWVTGPSSCSSVNNMPFINYLAGTALALNANMVVLQEVFTSVAELVSRAVVQALEATTKRKWFRLAPICAEPNDANEESYLYFWAQDADYTIMLDAAGQPLCGLGLGNPPGRFPNSRNGYSNSRKAAYAIFQSKDTNHIVCVTNYHAPADMDELGPIRGLQALASLTQLRSVDRGGTLPPAVPDAVILCGDYNINIQDEYEEYEEYLMDHTGTKEATLEKTHLKNKSKQVNPSMTSVNDYTNNGLDNIFGTTAIMTPGVVWDLIGENCPGGSLATYANNFSLKNNDRKRTPTFKKAIYTSIPITTPYNSFILVRYAISDHLPVAINVNI